MQDLIQLARQSRISVLHVLNKSKSPHIGSCFSVIDILVSVFDYKFSKAKVLEVDILLSKGHAAAALYAVLHQFNEIDEEDLDRFSEDGSYLYGHVDNFVSPHIPLSTGSLGHGLPYGLGLALGAKLKKRNNYISIVVMSDGELNEGTTWESLLIASHQGLNNLMIIIDRNFLQSLESTETTLALEPLKEKIESFGWQVLEVDGHDIASIQNSLVPSGKPLCLIANTTKGKNVSFMENSVLWHYKPPLGDDYEKALTELMASN
jgi:transketolase